MARKRVNTTKHEIIQVATALFLEMGVTHTSPKMIADELGISTGNITYYFPTKEHLLAALVEMLCDFRNKQMRHQVEQGVSALESACAEFAAMVTLCQESAVAADLYLSAYAGDLCLELIQRHEAERARQMFAAYRPDWTAEQFTQAAVLVTGMEQASLRANGFTPSAEARVRAGLEAILGVYGVPAEQREALIAKVASADWRTIAQKEFCAFTEYVAKLTEETLDEMFAQMRYRYK